MEYEVPELSYEDQCKIAGILEGIDEKIELNTDINKNLPPLQSIEFKVTYCGGNEETPQVFSSLLAA